MKKNGFTLIELLAVIIILAVIALIATPIVLDVVKDAKISGDKSNVVYYANALELKLAEDYIKNGGSYSIDVEKLVSETVTNGKKPEKCLVKINEGSIALKDCETNSGKYCYVNKMVYDDCANFDDIWNSFGEDEEVKLNGIPIIDKAKELVYSGQTCKTDGTTYNYMGGCYLKGTQTNNYIWFSGFLYRIMGINVDGSVRMITEENVAATPYNVSDNTNFTGSHVESWLNEYFMSHLKGKNKLVESKFCQGSINLTENFQRTDCTDGIEITKKIGTISIDEYNLSGAKNSYLKSNQKFFTMSPHSTSKGWYVNYTGDAIIDRLTYAIGLRAIINVNSATIITKGNGTLSDNYILNEDKSVNVTGNLNNKATSGEYVKLSGKIYRFVGKNNDGTSKLIYDGYYQEVEGTNYTLFFGDNNIFTTNSGIGQKLNTSVLEWLVPASDSLNRNKIKLDSRWYQNPYIGNQSYTEAIKENDTPIIATVGLINLGEMLSGQSASILTKNHTTNSSYLNGESYWSLTPHTEPYLIWVIYDWGSAGFNYSGKYVTYGIRPVININANVTISSGNGTLSSPYEI